MEDNARSASPSPGLRVPMKLAEVCDPARTALIVYDMQVGVVRQISEGAAITAQCAKLLRAARQGGYPVYFLRHRWLPNRLAGVGQLRRAMVWQRKDSPADTRPLFAVGSPDHEIVPELTPDPEQECVIDKITMSAFEGTFLAIALRDAGIQSFIICGIALEIGIAPTVRQALDLNLIPVVATDACGSRTAGLKTAALQSFEETGEILLADVTALVATLSAPNI